MTKTLFSTITAIAAATALLLSGCGSSNDTPATSEENLPHVAATTAIWADVIRGATCGQVRVTSIIPSDADPHHFEPKSQDIIALEDAALVVSNGLNLEEHLQDSLKKLSRTLTVADLLEADEHDHAEAEDDHDDHADETEADHDDHAEEDDHGHDHAEGVDLDHVHEETEAEDDHDDHADETEADHDDHAEEDDHGHDHSGPDPHLWFDFKIVAELVEHVAEELESQVADPAALQECAANYKQELENAEKYVSEQLASVPQANRLLVTQHQTLERLAGRFGYTILGSLIPSTSTLADANLQNIGELIKAIEETGVKAIFVDASGDSSDVESISKRIGDTVSVVELYTESLSDEDGPASGYLEMMRYNAEQIAKSLS